ncbi:MAG TPA: hypothetical protein VFF42_06630 [Candidatus Eremiobacteraceae bacterium]|nr:hypothetical protein [Candidatus Eremiobacteraceae bacterium]
MPIATKYSRLLFAILFFVAGAALFSTSLAGQDESWRIVRATYGYRSQVADVTALLLDLISRGGADGKIFISNETLGGDPAPEKVKTLRIFARNYRNETREFTYAEKTALDIYPFLPPRDNRERPERVPERIRDADDRYQNDDWRDRDDYESFTIIRAFYGVNGSTANVTERLRSYARGHEGISMKVNNTNLGGDPAQGAEKILIVIYRFHHQEQALVVPEGDNLILP